MDVTALNLGMIAAYYNISCEFLMNSYVNFTPTLSHRCYRRGLHPVAQGKDETQGIVGSRVFISRIRISSYSAP